MRLLLANAYTAAAAKGQDIAVIVEGVLQAINPAVRVEGLGVGKNGRVNGGFAEGHTDGRLFCNCHFLSLVSKRRHNSRLQGYSSRHTADLFVLQSWGSE